MSLRALLEDDMDPTANRCGALPLFGAMPMRASPGVSKDCADHHLLV